MIEFRDFVPQKKSAAGVVGEPEFQSLTEVLEDCNAWLGRASVSVLNVETVVLPNVHHPFEEGSQDVNIRQDDDFVTPWNQFIRVWYQSS